MKKSSNNLVHSSLVIAYERVSKGWCQHEAERIVKGKSQYCLVGSLVGFGSPTAEVYAGISAVDPTFAGFSAAKWNDMPGRTKQEVLAALDVAIALAE